MSNPFLKDYEPVEDRLAKFWADHPEGRVLTELLPASEGEFIVKAYAYRNTQEEVAATGLAHEVIGQGNVNKTSALENCETSAIGRALANLGYAPKGKRPSREEMQKTMDPATWLAQQVATLEKWSEAARREHYTLAMNYLGYEKLDSREKAEHVFNHMQSEYSWSQS